jgi:glucose-1-phosphate cytidylyltransferase
VGNINITGALQFHRKHGKKLTLTAVHPPGRFGELSVDERSCVRQFNEKPQTEGGRINGGFFVASTRIFDYLHDSDGMMFEQAPVRALAREGELMGWQHNGFWQPMDTFQEFTLLNKMWAEGNAPWKNW